MSITYEEFLKKYLIDDFKTNLKLTGRNKIDFYNDIDKLLGIICRIFDKLTSIAPMRGGQVLMALAKLSKPGVVINKTDIKNNLDIDRLEKLYYAFDYLEEHNYIKIEKKTEKFHIIRLNEEEIPDLKIFREIVQKYWTSPEEEKEKAKRWSGEK
ncbi:MAG: hypothetical protein EAX89_06355 [Candidatus Lokiarchaeota archaeon]|nr:hypothetical protein [Candidatus Lokiarchaeota archaeon]